MSEAFLELGNRAPPPESLASLSTFRSKPRLLTLGGDHSIALPALDTWHPAKYPSHWLHAPETGKGDPQSFFNHGSMFWIASKEGLIANSSSIHAGLRTRLSGDDEADYLDDTQQGWERIATDDIDDIGAKGIIERIMSRVGTRNPVYLSVDIDVIDPGLAPGTGTPEPGGWTTRELIRILRGIEDMNVVGADIVEVSPAYDGAGEVTAQAAAQVGFEILSSMVKRGLVNDDSAAMASAGGEKDEL